MSKVIPLHDRVLVRRKESEEKTKGGIVLPNSGQEQQLIGEVISVGPGKRNDKGEIIPLNVKVGDSVVFGKYAGTELKLHDSEKDLLMMREEDILGILHS